MFGSEEILKKIVLKVFFWFRFDDFLRGVRCINSQKKFSNCISSIKIHNFCHKDILEHYSANYGQWFLIYKLFILENVKVCL